MVVVDAKPRRGYWCGKPTGNARIDWITWTGKTLGLSDKEREYPVLVQYHALDRIFRRLNLADSLEGATHWFLYESLKKPVFRPLPTAGSCFLVEYRFCDEKLGYLVARVTDNKVLVQTFLFLTMDGTPEGTELWKQLRLHRLAKKYLGLDEFKTFVATDLRADREIVALLRGCGCGHLFDAFTFKGVLQSGYAQAIRKYLGMGCGQPALMGPSANSVELLRNWLTRQVGEREQASVIRAELKRSRRKGGSHALARVGNLACNGLARDLDSEER